jgi:hypothetical protein
MSFGFLVVVIGTDYMREIQLCSLGFLVVVIGADYMREILTVFPSCNQCLSLPQENQRT